MTTPFAFVGSLQVPGSPSLPADPLPFGLAAVFDSRAEYEFNLSSAPGSQTVNFGTVPPAGVKGMLVVYDAQPSAAPVLLAVNGSADPIELSAGGFLALGSPTPVAGVISLAISHTGAARVRVWLLG